MSDATVVGVPVRRPLLRLAALGRPVRSSLLLAVLAGAATVGCGIALLAVSGFLLARASQHPNIVALSIAVVAVRALGIGRGLARYVERLAGHDAALRVLADLRASVYRRLEQLAPAGLSGFQGGDLLARFIADVDSVQDLFIRGVTPPLVAVLAGGGSVVLAAAVWSPAGAVLAGGLVLAGVVLPLLSGYLADRSAEESVRARAELAVTSVDIIDGAAELVALGAEDVVLDRLAAADRTLTERARRLSVVAAIGTSGAAVVSGLTVFGVLLTSVAAAGHGALGRVPLAVLVLTALAAFEATSALPAAATALVGTRAAARRVFAVLDAPEPVHDSTAATASMPQGPLTLTLRGVAVRHPGSNRDVLRGLDLEVRPGSKVAIVGASGVGKSTLINVLLRFLDLSAGRYLINGVDATQVPAEKLRRRISGCTADPHIFDSTVRANLALARPAADDAALRRVLAVVKLDKWLAGLPDGLDTSVGAHGLAMSGGERQRIAVARALLANPDVVVFDEPTAHLDAGTADALMADLMSAVAGRTVVLITHDRRGLSAMDEVYELRDGCLRRVGADGGASDVVRIAGSARP